MAAFSLKRLGGIMGLLVLVLAAPLSAQEAVPISPFVPVEGTISAGQSQPWQFFAPEGAVLSFRAEATGGDLDPIITLQNSAGTTLISNDDFDHPASTDALLEAISIPRPDTYTLTVSGFGDTSGSYRLTMLSGYSDLLWQDNFDTGTLWEPDSEDTLLAEAGSSGLELQLEGVRQISLATNANAPYLESYYTEAAVGSVSGRNGWIAGVGILQQNSSRQYLFMLSNQGLWRFVERDGETLTILRDWTPHPAIAPGEAAFTLGIMAHSRGFEFYYNRQYIGAVTGLDIPVPGQAALLAATPDMLGSSTNVVFSGLYITAPGLSGSGGIFPQQFIVAGGNTLVAALQRRQFLPGGGSMALTLPESFAQSLRPGVVQFPLGRGATFQNFAMGGSITMDVRGEGTGGCGLILRDDGQGQYVLAYADNSGGFGLSQRSGDTFMPGVFSDTLPAGGGPHHLLVIALQETVHLYVNGRYGGSITANETSGLIGNAVVNFDPVDSNCRFNDLWLWQWD